MKSCTRRLLFWIIFFGGGNDVGSFSIISRTGSSRTFSSKNSLPTNRRIINGWLNANSHDTMLLSSIDLEIEANDEELKQQQHKPPFYSSQRVRFTKSKHIINKNNGRSPVAQSTTYNRYGRRRQERQDVNMEHRQWLEQATANLLSSEPGTLTKGKWHELASMLSAWSSFVKDDAAAPLRMESILKRLNDERRAGNDEARADISMYNRLLDAWACAALFRTTPNDNRAPKLASQRAREILVSLQETYEQEQDDDLMPNQQSFNVVLHVVSRIEGATIARRLLAWMEYLYKSGKNTLAKPSRNDYILLLDTYANSRDGNAGELAEGFLRHMNATGVPIDTLCYNIAIKAWSKANCIRRESAEHADQILSEMHTQKDLVTYTSVISAWAASGMRAHAVARAEELLQEVKDHPELQPNTVIINAVMSAWVKSRNPAASNRTGELLKEMEQLSSSGKNDHIKPDLISYNTHIHSLSLQATKPGIAERADQLLLSLEDKYDEGTITFAPNLFSYNLVIDCWSRSQRPDAGKRGAQVLGRLAKRNGIDPDTFSFNQVLSALSKTAHKYKDEEGGAADLAEKLLQYQEKAYELGIHPNARPDVYGYSSVIMAHSRSGQKGAAERAEKLLDSMKEKYLNGGQSHLKPNRICYNSLITAWAKSGEGTYGARKAESLLREMEILYQAGDSEMAPNIITYNAVLNAWARSGTRCCGLKAESYLNRMWQLYETTGDDQVKPNDMSYNTVINAISKSKNRYKGQRALRILRRMDKLYRAGNKEARPNEVTYTAVLNSCAFPPPELDSQSKRKAFDTAIFTLQELQASRYGQPNQITYGTFIKACANLIPDEKERRDIIIKVFQQCCKDGQVGEMVLTHLKYAAPADLYQELFKEIGVTITATNFSNKKSKNMRKKSRAPLAPSASSSSSPSNIKSRSNYFSTITVEDLPIEWRCNVRRDTNKRWSPNTTNLSNRRKSQP